jgi:hypothetical protein
MKKEIKHYTCRKCNTDFSAPIRQGRDPQYCSDQCRGKDVDRTAKPTIWHLNCKACKKDWSMERVKQSGRKPHFCPDCYDVANKERHKQRLKERDRSYVSKKELALAEQKMVNFVPVKPLIDYLKQNLIKNEDWAVVTSRDRSAQTQMAAKLGTDYNSLTYWLRPGAMMNVYKADEYAIRLRTTPNAYLGNKLL